MSGLAKQHRRERTANKTTRPRRMMVNAVVRLLQRFSILLAQLDDDIGALGLVLEVDLG